MKAVEHLFPLFAALNWHWVWLVVAAFLAGVLNAVAGGGSFLAFPAMLGTGILPVQANATNTVALWPGQLTSIVAYWQEMQKNRRLLLPMGLAGLLGGTAGALLLLSTPQTTFLHMVPWLLLFAATTFAASGPVTRWLRRRKAQDVNTTARPHILPVFIGTIMICFYIGYFGAGAGFLLITLLSLFGFQNLTEINALKVVTTTLANGIAVIIFALSGQVVWPNCLVAMVVSAIGGYLSARIARRLNQSFLRALVIAIGFTMAAWFFWSNR